MKRVGEVVSMSTSDGTRNRKNKMNSKKGPKKIRNKKTDELEELERSLIFVAIKRRFWRKPNINKEELKL